MVSRCLCISILTILMENKQDAPVRHCLCRHLFACRDVVRSRGRCTDRSHLCYADWQSAPSLEQLIHYLCNMLSNNDSKLLRLALAIQCGRVQVGSNQSHRLGYPRLYIIGLRRLLHRLLLLGYTTLVCQLQRRVPPSVWGGHCVHTLQ